MVYYMENKAWRGAVTVEGAIVMPVVLIILMTLMMFAVFIYERAAARAVCNHIAAEGAVIWPRGLDYMEKYYAKGGIKDNEKEDQDETHIFHVYMDYFTYLVDSEQNPKTKLLEQQVEKEFASRSLVVNEKNVKATVKLESVLIHKHLVVTIDATYKLPFYSASSRISAESVISGQTELIRNIDLAVDMLSGPFSKVKEGYQQVKDKLRELLDKVKIEKKT